MSTFPLQERLTKARDFQSVFACPKKNQCVYFLALCKSNQFSYARLGIIIAKHRMRRAVDRNRVRRIVRESFRGVKETLKGLDIIVLLRSQTLTQNHLLTKKKCLRQDIDSLWKNVRR